MSLPQLGDERIIEISAPFGYKIGSETRRGILIKIKQQYVQNNRPNAIIKTYTWKDVEFVD